MADTIRADLALVQQGLAQSREKAQVLIMAGEVYAGSKKITKSSEKIDSSVELTVRGKSNPYVGRGAYKLEKALRVFQANVNGCVAMDIGAATGGFTDVLLQNGAQKVYAIDVGYGQLDWKIRSDSRVVVMERTNARYLQPTDFEEIPNVTVMDVSFISVEKILPVAAMLMNRQGRFYILIKPQFEAGKENVGKKGVVRDAKVHCQVIQKIVDFAPSIQYYVSQLDYSPITGPEGNIEYLAELLPMSDTQPKAVITAEHIKQLVQKSHEAFQKQPQND